MTTCLVSSSENNNVVVMRIKDVEGLVASSPRLTDEFFLKNFFFNVAAAAAKSLQLCPTLCDPIDGSPPDSSVHGIL